MEQILSAAAHAGLTLDSEAAQRFAAYLDLLLRWNAKLNLTALRQPAEIIQRHLIECIFAAGRVPIGVKTLLDFGSGAGLPGVPIAICRPEISVTLAESQGKKAAFLRETVRTLALKADVFFGRVEDMPQARLFDAVALRAVDKMAEACKMAAAKVAPKGYLLIFSTRGEEAGLITRLGDFDWAEATALPGLQHGILMTGIRTVPRETT